MGNSNSSSAAATPAAPAEESAPVAAPASAPASKAEGEGEAAEAKAVRPMLEKGESRRMYKQLSLDHLEDSARGGSDPMKNLTTPRPMGQVEKLPFVDETPEDADTPATDDASS